MKFCSACGTASHPDAQFCGKCGKAFESYATATKPTVEFENKNITVVVKNESKTPIFSIFGICCGFLGIFTLGFVFIPLGFLFTLFGLLRGEFLFAVISGGINVVGFLTSPVLVAMLGLSVLLGSSDLTKRAPDPAPQARQPTTGTTKSGGAESSPPAIVAGNTSNAVSDDAPKSTKTIEEIVASAYGPIIEASQRAEYSTEVVTSDFPENIYVELQSLLVNQAEHCSGNKKCVVNEFTLYSEDIDDDDRPEFIVTHSDFCGAGGCKTLLMAEGSDHTWHRLASVFGDISVDSTSTLGKKDIHFQRKVYRTEGGWYIAQRKFVWSGNKYINGDK